MVKFGRYKFSKRKSASFMGVVMSTVKFVLLAYVGGLVLINIISAMNMSQGCLLNSTGGTDGVIVACNPMTTAFTLLGATTTTTTGGITLGTTGLISIIGVLGAVYLVMKFVTVRRV